MSFKQGVHALGVFAVLLGSSASAATTQISALLDTDNNRATGCTVNTTAGSFDGVEQVLTTTFDTDAKVVMSVTRQQCSGGVLGSPQSVDAGGWAVGTSGGLFHVETHIPWTLLGATAPIHLGATATSAALSAVVLQRPDGSIIMFPGLFPSTRHHVVNPSERNIILDGQVGDWNGLSPLASGSASNGTNALRFINIYAAQNATDLFFLFDIQSNPAAPTANDDNYSVQRGATLTVPPPGVLSNDHDPNLLPLTALLISGVQHGTLTLNSNGGFTYVNDGSAALVDSFHYKANNGSADSNPAQVTIAIISGTAPVITSANSTTFTVGTNSTFTVTATGNPTPSISESGALPNGVTFNTGTHAFSGTPAAGTGGVYNVAIVATNGVGTATQNFSLFVNEAPSVKTSPASQTVCAGATATFTAAASGFPAPTAQWQVSTNGGATFTNIPGAVAATYAFIPAPSDNGNQYRAVFTNGLGNATTSAATLTVNVAAVVTTQPVNQTACAGTNATFTAAASGTPAPTVQWQVSTDSGATFTDVAGATSTTYTFATTSADNGKQYRAVFTNACAAVNSSAATLTVNTAPAVTTNPASQTVCDSTTATFTAAASGSPAATVQWQVSIDNGVTFNNIAGATSTPYSFTATSADNTKQYRAVFTNSCGTANSAAATLTVTTTPVITTNPATQTICAGGPVSFTAATSSPASTVQWQRSIDGGATFNNLAGATSTTLTFTTAPADNGNQYRAVFTNICGSTNTTAATLTVNVGAAVTTQPTPQTVCDTQTATFTAAASGTPAPTVQWQVSTNGGATFTDVPGATSTTFSFTANAAQNANQYRAVFTNSCATAISNAATLTVNTPPTVTTNPLTQTLCAGNTASFTVAATGQPTPTVQWQLSIDGGATFNNINGATLTTLSFTAQPTDSGHQFRAVLTNTCGTATSSAATLTVNTAPFVTTSPASQTICPGPVSFTAAATGSPVPTVQWQLSVDGGVTFNDIVGQTGTTYSFDAVPGNTGNQFRAVFTNACGTAATNAATLTVNSSPQVTTPPASQAVCNNATATFTAAASGQPAPTVQWQVSIDGGVTFNDIPGATSTTLSFTATTADNTKQYHAVFTNTCGTATTTAATLTVDQTIAINTQPTDQSVTAGNPVTFTASASNFTSVQWMVSTDGGTTFNNVPGATTETLTFTAQLTDNAKKFKAVYTNSCGTAATNVVTLTVTCSTITVARSGGGSFPNGTFNAPYTDAVTATGGTVSHTFAITSGSLPSGLSINANTGAITGTTTATGVFSFTVTATDVGDACTGSQSFMITVLPAVHDATYSAATGQTDAVGNTQAVTAGYSAVPTTPKVTYADTVLVRAGDQSNAAMTVSAGAACNSGTIAFDSDGNWLYTPAAGFTGTAVCGYTVTSNGVSAGANLNIVIANRVWYVNNSGPNGNGESQSPFSDLTSFGTVPRVSPDAAGDIIFIFNGNSATTKYDGGVKLLDNEQLLGEGVALVVNGNSLVSAGTKPQVTNTAPTSDAVLLANGNTVKGLTLTGATRDGIRGASVSGLTADTLTIQNNVTALDINPMTGVVTVTNTTVSNNSFGLLINGGSPNFTMNNTNSISGSTSDGVTVQNLLAAGVVNIGATITDSSLGGSIILGGNASGSSISFTGTQTLDTHTGVSMTSNSGVTITFSGTLNVGSNTPVTGTGFGAIGGGTLNVSGTANITGGAGAIGLSLNGITIGSSGVTFTSVGGTGMTTGISIVNTTVTNPNPVQINGGTITNPTTGLTMQGLNTNVSLNNLTISGATTGITNTTNFGTLGVGANVNVGGATAINLTTGTISGSFTHVSSTGGTNGVSFTGITTSNAWGCTCSGDTLTGATGATFKVTGGNNGGLMTWGGTINQANAADAVNISGGHAGFLTFSGNVTTSGASTGINISGSSGTYNFTGGASTITGTGGGILIQNESGSISFGAGYSINGPATAFKIGGTATATTATITYSGSITDSVAGGTLIDINSTAGTYSSGTIFFNSASPTALTGNAAGTGVVAIIKNMTGTLNLNNLSLTATSGAFNGTLLSIGGTNTGGNFNIDHVTLAATGLGNTGKGLTVAAGSGGTYKITSNGGASSISVGSTALQMDGTGNAVTLGPSSIAGLTSLGNGAAGAVILTNVGNGGATTISSGSLTGVSGAPTFLISGGTPNLTFSGTISQSNGNPAVSITGISTAGVASFTNTITKNGTAANAISITSNTNGSFSFSGAITASTSTANAINLTNNTGATISFTGNLGLTTTTGTAFNATGGGTVTATNASSTVNATGGVGVNITNTTIGAGNVTFFSVNANGGAAGIFIDTTGTTGSFIVTGTVASVTKDDSGGTIQGMSGADGSTQGHGIYLNSTKNVSLKHMSIQNNQGDGIHGNAVNGLTLQYCNIGTVTGNGTTTAQLGNFHGEGDAQFVDLTTSALIDNNAFSNAFYNTLGVFNNNNTSINRVVITNNTFGTQNALNGNDACTLQATDGTFNATFSNNTVSWADGDQFQLDMHGGVTSDLIMASNQLNNTAGANIISGGGGVTIGSGGASDHVTFTFNLNNNTITGAAGAGLGLSTGSTGVAGKFQNFNGSITNNTFGNTGVTDSGSTGGSDVGFIDSGSQFTLTFTGNHLSQYNPSANGALAVTVGDDAGNVANFVATVTGNTISNPGSNAANVMQGIAINVGPSATDVSRACLTMFGNTLTGSGKNGGSELRVRQRASSHIGLLGNGTNYSGAANDTTAVVNFETSQNTVTSSAAVSATTNAPGGFQGTCP